MKIIEYVFCEHCVNLQNSGLYSFFYFFLYFSHSEIINIQTMKNRILILFITILFFACNDSEHHDHQRHPHPEDFEMKNEKSERGIVKETVTKFFVAVDEQDWEIVRNHFEDSVIFDYTSMQGGEAKKLSSGDIADSWKAFLPGFDNTHHQLGNYLVKVKENKAHLFCYVTAKHFLKNESDKNVWTVVGTYDIDLTKNDSDWFVSDLKFTLKYTSGNENLPEMAKNIMNNK